MLVGGVTTLKRQTSERQYGDAAMLLQVSKKNCWVKIIIFNDISKFCLVNSGSSASIDAFWKLQGHSTNQRFIPSTETNSGCFVTLFLVDKTGWLQSRIKCTSTVNC